MMSLFPSPGSTRRQPVHMSRRDAMALGSLGTLGLALPGTQSSVVASSGSHPATAKRCIYIFLCGGPSQLDMWDPKPHAPDSIRGLGCLTDRGMLDDTLVVVTGEFGRTPKINQFAGRDHWAPCYSSVLAGGGVRGGAIHGASDEHAAYVKDSPVHPEDMGATILHAFGFSPNAEIIRPTGRPVRISKGHAVTQLFS